MAWVLQSGGQMRFRGGTHKREWVMGKIWSVMETTVISAALAVQLVLVVAASSLNLAS